MEKLKIGQIIRDYRESVGMGQKQFLELLTQKGAKKIDIPRLSRLEHGLEGNEELYLDVCAALDITMPDTDNRLFVGFTQGFWAAPLVWMNEHSANKEFFDAVSLTAYAHADTHQVAYSKRGERLEPFDPYRHGFFHSGEVADLLHTNKIDVGFLGSTVADHDSDLVRVARLVKANAVRHAMLVAAPKGRFADLGSLLRYLLTPATNDNPHCHIYYQSKSTAEREYRTLLQFAGHEHNTIDVMSLPALEAGFAQKLQAHEGGIVGLIGLILSADWAERGVRGMDERGEKYDIFKFKTTDIAEMAAQMGLNNLETPNFYYEMVVARNNEKIKALAQHAGFRLLIKLLRSAVKDLEEAKTEKGISLSHRKVADFFGLNRQQAHEMLQQTDFELMFYPEWVSKVLA